MQRLSSRSIFVLLAKFACRYFLTVRDGTQHAQAVIPRVHEMLRTGLSSGMAVESFGSALPVPRSVGVLLKVCASHKAF